MAETEYGAVGRELDRSFPPCSRVHPPVLSRPRLRGVRAVASWAFPPPCCPHSDRGSRGPDAASKEPSEALGSWGSAPLPEGTPNGLHRSRQTPLRSQPGSWRSFYSQPKPNEVCRSQNPSSQTGRRLSVHVFVFFFLKGIDLKRAAEEEPSNGEK